MSGSNVIPLYPSKKRHSIDGDSPSILADIYQDEVNIAVWQRQLTSAIQQNVAQLFRDRPSFQLSITVTADAVIDNLLEVLGPHDYTPLANDVSALVDMFCDLFALERIGLRLTVLNKAMCPRFHVDRVPCRLVTTYQGIATQWLPHHLVNRSKLGMGSQGLPDNESGLYSNHHDIQQLNCADVALLKGELWSDNEGAGLVHRSPAVDDNEPRLLMTIDFAR